MAGIAVTARDPEQIMTDTSQTPPPKNGLMLRVLSALVMMPIAIFIILQGGLIYCLFVALISVLILYEWNGICEAKPLNIVFLLQSLLVLVCIYSLYSGIYFYPYAYLIIFGLVITAALFFKMKLPFAFLGVIYALVPALSLVWVRLNFDQGGLIVLWMMIVVWSMDTGAYFAGKNIGGPKLAPRISPNKTWAGLIGGALTAIVFGLIAAYFMGFGEWDNGLSLFLFVPLTAVLAIWSQVGDLAESALKRHFNVKDSGAIIPGHGGIMDRVDGVLFAAPAVLLFLSL